LYWKKRREGIQSTPSQIQKEKTKTNKTNKKRKEKQQKLTKQGKNA
jgi:hypothetical protein